MTSTISSNNKKNSFVALTKWSLLKAVPVTVVYSSILFLAFPVLFFGLDVARQISVSSTIKMVLTYSIPAIVMIFTIVVGANMFGIYQKKRSIDLYGSFPVKRRTLLLSKYVAGLIVLLIPLFVFGLLGGITPYFSSVDKETYNVVAVVMSKCITIAIGVIASYTMFTFLSMCCGTTSSSIISYIVINLIYPFLILFVVVVFASIVPGFSHLLVEIFPTEIVGDISYTTPVVMPGIVVCFLSPVLATFISADLDLFNMDIPEIFSKYIGKSEFIVYWILFIAVILACTLYIAQKRKNENVQNGFIYKLPKIIVTMLATVTMGIFIGFLFRDVINVKIPFIFSYLLGTFAGGLLAFTVFTLLYNRGVSGFIKELPILGVSYIIVIISGLVISTGVFGTDSYVPKTEDIESVAVTSDIAYHEAESYDDYLNRKSVDEYAGMNFSWYLDKDKNIVPMNFYMSDESIIKDTVAMHQNIVDNLNNMCGNLYSIEEAITSSDSGEKPYYLEILYKMKDGSVVKRTYDNSDYDVKQIRNMYNKIASTETYKKQYYGLMQCDSKCVTHIDIMGDCNGLHPALAGEVCIKYNNNQQIVKELYEALRKDVIADKDLVATFDIEESSFDIEKGYTEWNKWNYGDEMIIEIQYDNSYYSLEYTVPLYGIPPEIFIIPKDKYTNVWNVLEKYSNDELNFEDKSGLILYNN